MRTVIAPSGNALFRIRLPAFSGHVEINDGQAAQSPCLG